MKLLGKGEFPRMWMPTMAERDLRQLLAHGDKLVRMRRRIKCQLQHITLNQGLQKKPKLWSRARTQVAGRLSVGTVDSRDDLRKLFDEVEAQCRQLDRAATRAAMDKPRREARKAASFAALELHGSAAYFRCLRERRCFGG